MKKKLLVIMGLIIIGLTACNSDEEKAVMHMVENIKIAESTAEQESTGSEEYSTDEGGTDENELPTAASDPTPETEETEQAGYTVETIDKKMYVKEWCNTYMGPNEQAYELFGECNKGELVHLTGQIKEESNWYEYEVETGDKGFISGEYLVAENPLQQEVAQKTNTPEQPKQEQPKQEPTQQTPVQEQQPSYDDEHLPPGVLPGQSYDPETGRVWQPGDDMGFGTYLGTYDDIDNMGLADWGN